MAIDTAAGMPSPVPNDSRAASVGASALRIEQSAPSSFAPLPN
jgi:hypothetical protein